MDKSWNFKELPTGIICRVRLCGASTLDCNEIRNYLALLFTSAPLFALLFHLFPSVYPSTGILFSPSSHSVVHSTIQLIKKLATGSESRHSPDSLTDSWLFPALKFTCEVLLLVKCQLHRNFTFYELLSTFGTHATQFFCYISCLVIIILY